MSTDAMLATLFVGSLLLIEPLEGFDRDVTRQLSQPGSEGNTAVRAGGRAAGTLPVLAALTAGTHLFGRLSGNSTLGRAGLHSLEALLVAEAATQLVKIGVGRGRPTVSAAKSDDLRPLRFDSDYHSFPSGHTSKVFAVAATLSSELKDEAPWVLFVVYPLATWTAATRVLDRKHWMTDIVGGAALGILSSRLVERLHYGARAEGRSGVTWTLVPGAEGGVGFAVHAPLP